MLQRGFPYRHMLAHYWLLHCAICNLWFPSALLPGQAWCHLSHFPHAYAGIMIIISHLMCTWCGMRQCLHVKKLCKLLRDIAKGSQGGKFLICRLDLGSTTPGVGFQPFLAATL